MLFTEQNKNRKSDKVKHTPVNRRVLQNECNRSSYDYNEHLPCNSNWIHMQIFAFKVCLKHLWGLLIITKWCKMFVVVRKLLKSTLKLQ
jgi:hypothetical protein